MREAKDSRRKDRYAQTHALKPLKSAHHHPPPQLSTPVPMFCRTRQWVHSRLGERGRRRRSVVLRIRIFKQDEHATTQDSQDLQSHTTCASPISTLDEKLCHSRYQEWGDLSWKGMALDWNY